MVTRTIEEKITEYEDGHIVRYTEKKTTEEDNEDWRKASTPSDSGWWWMRQKPYTWELDKHSWNTYMADAEPLVNKCEAATEAK